jgi:hypothetical protein
MQAITVKFLCPTNHRGARYRAKCEAGAVTVPQDYALNPYENALEAVHALLGKLEWSGKRVGGSLPQGGWAFVCVGHDGVLEVK